MEQASSEVIMKFAATTIKAAATLPEIRDTCKPDLVSGLLMTILEANGAVFSTPLLRKRVRDTVSFDNAHKPWRRSPFYLMARVAMQRYLYRKLGAEIGRLHYKFIMCLMLSQLLEEVLKRLSFDAAFFLRQKLGRRLAKLESDMANAPGPAKKIYASLFRSLEPTFQATLATTGGYLKSVWRNHKQRSERRVPLIRQRAFEHEYYLRLGSSGKILTGILTHQSHRSLAQQTASADLLMQYEQSVASVKPYVEAASHHISVSKYLEDVIVPAKVLGDAAGPDCIVLSETIRGFVRKIENTRKGYPDQLSRMILHLMELWALMDKAAVACFPLLKEYHPGFDPDILDPIQLLTLEEMERVKQIQGYLNERCLLGGGMRCLTIFEDPSDDCFAARFYDDSELSEELLKMRDRIEEHALLACSAKEVEWEKKSTQHREIIDKCNEKECKWDAVRIWDGTVRHNHRWPCEWHELQDEAKSIRIRIFEHPLPSFEPAVKATLFELRCPAAYAAYRDATWLILSTLCHPPVQKLERISLIREYSQLQSYSNGTKGQVCLGSDRKAHLDCHYSNWGFPIGIQEVCRSCGLKPRYYDIIGQTWTKNRGKASLWHHFPVMLPRDSPYQGIEPCFANWPSSNEVQASQASCPPDVSVHEFQAWQGLLVGTHSRWFDLLRELGSTNLNFSADSTWVLVQRLILQVGPATISEDPRRDVHSAFLDHTFCDKLLGQIRQRLESIHRNWREPVQMDILITILLKLVSLSPCATVRDAAIICLRSARHTTHNWCTDLRSIITEDTKATQFAIWASLLCKRTVHFDCHVLLESETLRQFLHASIMLQYSLNGNFEAMPYNLRTAIMRDVSFSYENRLFLRHTIIMDTHTFNTTVNILWQIPKYSAEFTELQNVPNTWWILLTLKSEDQVHLHSVHYNYIYGTLLIDGQEMSALPLVYRNNPLYRQIFGNRNPIVLPSPLSGMTFMMSDNFKSGHRIHLGFRKTHDLILRVAYEDQVLELIPRGVFGTKASPDLPVPLIEGCFHWLNVYSGCLEIRRQDMWISKPGNWWIFGIRTGTYRAVRRAGKPTETRLLEPSSSMVRDIAKVFDYFECPSQIMVFVSRDGKVSAELKNLELSFYINDDGVLQSQRLGAVITPNQDAGTWYGLKSKILIQSTGNRRQKSVLVPSGNIQYYRDGPHVSLKIETGSSTYLKFSINEVLGRIDCAPEPKLLYVRALLHAYTSHVMSDPLTRRTGLEEAIYLLQTGSYLPWSPLIEEDIRTLARIADLSPVRGYYPEDMKCMETVTWQSNLPISMQDERYRALVANILRRSSDLSNFFLDRTIQPITERTTADSHLEARALSRTHLHKNKVDKVYFSRDKRSGTDDRSNVFQMIQLLRKWQSPISNGPTLTSLLQDAPIIGGYDKFFQKCLLTDLLTVDLRAEWGALAKKSLNCSVQDRYNLMFLFGPIAFSHEANVSLMRVLISFVMIPELRTLKAPPYPAYFHFRADGAPRASYLISLMEKAKMPFLGIGFKKRSQLVIAESQHEEYVKKSCEVLACAIQEQWPNPEIRRERLSFIDPMHLNIDTAISDVTPEWVRLCRNHEFALYLDQVQAILDRFIASEDPSPVTDCLVTIRRDELYPTRSKTQDNPWLSTLLQNSIDLQLSPRPDLVVGIDEKSSSVLLETPGNIARQPAKAYDRLGSGGKKPFGLSPCISKPQHPQELGLRKLRNIVDKIQNTSSFVQKRYAKELNFSINALQRHLGEEQAAARSSYPRVTTEEIRPAKDHANSAAEHIQCILQAKNPQAKWLRQVEIWPKMTTVELLSELRSTSNAEFGPGMKEALVTFGLAISKWQHLLRIQDAQKRHKEQQERDEWSNKGHTNWSPLTYPDWLLLEIDGNILLREEQVQVALATIAPQSGENSVLQLLMGKGKTSCILRQYFTCLGRKTVS